MPKNRRKFIVLILALEGVLIFTLGVFASRLASMVNMSPSILVVSILIGLIALLIINYLKFTFDRSKVNEISAAKKEKRPRTSTPWDDLASHLAMLFLGLPLTALGILLIVFTNENLLTKAILLVFIISSIQMSYEGAINSYYILSIRNIEKKRLKQQDEWKILGR